MAFVSLATTVRVVQVLAVLTAAALIGSLRILSLQSDQSYFGLDGLSVAVFVSSWYSMLLAVSFTRLSTPQHLPRILLASISIIVNAMIFLSWASTIGGIGTALTDPNSSIAPSDTESEAAKSAAATARSAATASLVLASMSCGLAFLHMGLDLVRMLQAATQLSLTMANQNFQAVHQFDHA